MRWERLFDDLEARLHLSFRDAVKGVTTSVSLVSDVACQTCNGTGELIPMCHPLNLTYVDVRFTVTEMPPTVRIEAETRTVGPTGVEMEAIVAAQTAAATIYDMCKAVQRDIVISRVRLLHKRGGKSGEFNASGIDA